MTIRFGFTSEPHDPDTSGAEVVPEVTWDEVLGDGYVEGDDDEGYA